MVDIIKVNEELDRFARRIGLSRLSDLVGLDRSSQYVRYIDLYDGLLLDVNIVDEMVFQDINIRELPEIFIVQEAQSGENTTDCTHAFCEADIDDEDMKTALSEIYKTILDSAQTRVRQTIKLCNCLNDIKTVLMICLVGYDAKFLYYSAMLINDLFQDDFQELDGIIVCILQENEIVVENGEIYPIALSIVRHEDKVKKDLCTRLGDLWKDYHNAGGHNASRNINSNTLEDIKRSNNKESLTLNKDFFESEYRKICLDRGIDPVCILQTSVILPYHIPLDGLKVTFSVNDKSLATIVFHSIKHTQPIYTDLELESPWTQELSKSFIEFIYATKDESNQLSNQEKDEISKVFDICLELLNYLVVSYQITYKDPTVYRITLPMLEPCCICRLIDPSSWKTDNVLLPLNYNIPYEKSVVSDAEASTVVHYANVLKQNWNPFMLSAELIVGADRNIAVGQYREAIINIQSGFESFIMILAQEIYKDEGKSLADLEARFINNGLIHILKSEFHNRLGGHWDITDASTAIGQWYAECYMLRNKVVHTGYMPTHDETQQAFFVCENFIQEIIASLKNNQKKYPDIARYFVVSIVDEKGEVIQHARDVIFGLSKDITDKPDKTKVTKDKT
ncbi:MAG TPA: hypothetical protein PK577_03525 [Candidatus Syntrophosphaera thermopropionivorans]|nr:hypothetical protein [Candidatus Syntrophosphaera thermopropionivorans]HPQ31007.1 hypothetical protein [Candidatus Syntrophosphaera thermopropionivorans]